MAGGQLFHVFGPGPEGAGIDPIDAEPSTITDFTGTVGLAYLNGTVTRTNRATGEVRTLPTVGSDMRFMQGRYRNTDGRLQEGTFAFVWVDVFEPGPGSQLHDLNPTAPPPTGLFWTIEVPRPSVQVDLAQGIANLQATHVPILDYGDIPNAIGGERPPVQGTVSFRVEWRGPARPIAIRNTDPVYGGYVGEFRRNAARMIWTARVGDFEFRSGVLETSSSTFALLGQERNGIFVS
jgi:hypothetical protein